MMKTKSPNGLAGLLSLIALCTVGRSEAQHYRPSFHPDRLRRPAVGRPNDVLVLGTMHLQAMPADFRADMLAPLIDRLAAWRPVAIAIEQTSGKRCDTMRRYGAPFAEAVKNYCYDPTVAGKAVDLDVPAANAEADRLLASWPATPTPSQRRRLAAVFLAAGEPGSALVQWLRLAIEDRQAGDGLTAELAGQLLKMQAFRNETYALSAPLAARLGLDRLWSVDDQGGTGFVPPDANANAAALSHAWNNPTARARSAQEDRLRANLSQRGGLIAWYRFLNTPEASLAVYKGDIGAALADPSPEGYGRGYVAYWETRNLRIAANLREILGRRPGARLLVILGASHKGYLEAYLNQMLDVSLADASLVSK